MLLLLTKNENKRLTIIKLKILPFACFEFLKSILSMNRCAVCELIQNRKKK